MRVPFHQPKRTCTASKYANSHNSVLGAGHHPNGSEPALTGMSGAKTGPQHSHRGHPGFHARDPRSSVSRWNKFKQAIAFVFMTGFSNGAR